MAFVLVPRAGVKRRGSLRTRMVASVANRAATAGAAASVVAVARVKVVRVDVARAKVAKAASMARARGTKRARAVACL